MMQVHRLGLKYYVDPPGAIVLPELIRVFHSWIQNKSVGGMLIDVADYKHIHHGPGVVLIGHDCEYRMDLADGRAGLNYVRKHDKGKTFQDSLRTALCHVLRACHQLGQEAALSQPIRFHTGEALLTLYDRLRAPNRPETIAVVQDDVHSVFAEVYAGQRAELQPQRGDPRGCPSIRIMLPHAPALAELLERLEQLAA